MALKWHLKCQIYRLSCNWQCAGLSLGFKCFNCTAAALTGTETWGTFPISTCKAHNHPPHRTSHTSHRSPSRRLRMWEHSPHMQVCFPLMGNDCTSNNPPHDRKSQQDQSNEQDQSDSPNSKKRHMRSICTNLPLGVKINPSNRMGVSTAHQAMALVVEIKWSLRTKQTSPHLHLWYSFTEFLSLECKTSTVL